MCHGIRWPESTESFVDFVLRIFSGASLLALFAFQLQPDVVAGFLQRASDEQQSDKEAEACWLAGATVVLGTIVMMAADAAAELGDRLLKRWRRRRKRRAQRARKKKEEAKRRRLGPVGVFGTYTSLREQEELASGLRGKTSLAGSSDSGNGSYVGRGGLDQLFDEDTDDLDSSDEEMLLRWERMRGAVRVAADNDDDDEDEDEDVQKEEDEHEGERCQKVWCELESLRVYDGKMLRLL